MFDITTSFDGTGDNYIDVIWINALNGSDIINKDENDCLKNANPSYNCILMAKANRLRTYNDPTSEMKDMIPMSISYNNWPNTVHLHGAEVRPTFDGNPLSWIDNQLQDNHTIGTGCFST